MAKLIKFNDETYGFQTAEMLFTGPKAAVVRYMTDMQEYDLCEIVRALLQFEEHWHNVAEFGVRKTMIVTHHNNMVNVLLSYCGMPTTNLA